MLNQYSSARYIYFYGNDFGKYNLLSYHIMQYDYVKDINELGFMIELSNELISILEKRDLSLCVEYEESEYNKFFALEIILLP